jgi:hypothetical protein
MQTVGVSDDELDGVVASSCKQQCAPAVCVYVTVALSKPASVFSFHYLACLPCNHEPSSLTAAAINVLHLNLKSHLGSLMQYC